MVVGKQKITGRIVAALAASAILLHLVPGYASAEETETDARKADCIYECDGRAVSECIDTEVDCFNRATVDWTADGCTLEATAELDRKPYRAFEGSRSLLVTPWEGRTPSITAKPAIKSVSGFRLFIVSLYFPESTGNTDVTVELTAKKGSFGETARVECGGWRTLCFDISDAGMSGKLSAVKMTFDTAGEFLVDTCGFSESEKTVPGIRFMSEGYIGSGCSVWEQKDRLTVTLSGEEPYIEPTKPLITDFSGGTGIRVRYENASSCRELTLKYTTPGSAEYGDRLSVTKSVLPGEGSVVFPIPEANIVGFRLCFEGGGSGEFGILSVCPDACVPALTYDGSITDCLVSGNGESITVTGAIAEENVKKYSGCSVYLYELELFEDTGGISLGTPAKAETVLNGGTFTFTFPVSETRDELFKKYAALAYTAGALVQLGEAVSVTNPETLAAEHGEYSSSVKGKYPITSPTVLEGTAHTAVMIDLGRLVTNSSENAVTHRVNGGKTYYFNKDFVLETDERMRELGNCGIGVNFVLYVGEVADVSLEGVLRHPLAEAGRKKAMFNVTSADGIGMLRAACDFLARRYALSSGVTDNAEGITVGDRVNDAHENCNMGLCDLTQFASAYSTALRVVYNAAKQVNSGLSVYMSIGSVWSAGSAAYPVASFDGEKVLSSVASCVKRGGDIGWKLACEAAVKNGGAFFWEEESEPSKTVRTVRPDSIEDLLSETAGGEYTYSGAPRQVMLLGTEEIAAADENEYIKYCAAFVYTYLKISQRAFDRVTVYIPSHPVDYGSVYEKIDTDECAAAAAFAGEIFGKERYEDLIDSVGVTVSNRHTEKTAAAKQIPSSVRSEASIFDFSSGTDGWYPAVGCSTVKGGTEVDSRRNVLSASFKALRGDEYRGISVDFGKNIDISAADYVSFEAKAAVLPADTDNLEMSVIFRTTDGWYSYVTEVGGSGWTLAVCKLPERMKNVGCLGMTVYVRGVDGKNVGGPTLLIDNVRALSDVRSEKELQEAIRSDERGTEEMKTVPLTRVIAFGAVFAAAAAIEVCRVVKRAKRKSA